jgi:hypothetical protein
LRHISNETVDEALPGIPGWERRGTTLLRFVEVEQDSRAPLREGIHAVTDPERCDLVELPDGCAVVFDPPGGLTEEDVEAAARVDTVLSGSGSDTGGSDQTGPSRL